MAIPSSVLAAGWIPFVVVLVLTFIFAVAYIRYFMSKYDGDVPTTVATTLALFVTLLSSVLVPVDIFLVSYMKQSNGSFKHWAMSNETRKSLEQSVSYTYYSLYCIISFFQFIVLPFMYFFYEEKDEETTTKSRICTALKYSIVFVIFAVTLLLIGAFVPNALAVNRNQTEFKRIEELIKSLGSNNWEDSLSFVISVLSLVGMLALIMYMAYGMSILPISLMKGTRSAKKERLKVTDSLADTRNQIAAIRDNSGGKRLTAKDRRRIEELHESERLMERQDRHLEVREKSICDKCLLVLRPFEVVFGIFFFLIAILVFLSLLLTNIDKALHGLGYRMGYALTQRTLPNPVDIVLVFSQKAFPVDYVLMAAIIMYFVFCAMAGIRSIGIWFLWIKMYKIRPHRTRPQGLIMLCMIMMFMVLAINIIIYELTPQYSMFGSQHSPGNDTSANSTVPCSTELPNCVMTRMSLLLTRFFYKMWFFGAAYYWLTWVFLGVFLLGFLVAVIKKRRSAIAGEVDNDDFDDSDDEVLIRP